MICVECGEEFESRDDLAILTGLCIGCFRIGKIEEIRSHKCSSIIPGIMGVIEKGEDNKWYWFHPQGTWGVGIKYCPFCGEQL